MSGYADAPRLSRDVFQATEAFREPLLGPGKREHAAHEPLINSEMVAEVS